MSDCVGRSPSLTSALQSHPHNTLTHLAADPATSRPLSWLLQNSRLDIWDTLLFPFPQLVDTSLSLTSRMLSLVATARLGKWSYNRYVCVLKNIYQLV